MAIVGFVVLFIGVVSSVLANSSTALLLAFVLPVTQPAGAGEIPQRLAGWALAGVVSIVAIALLWPQPTYDALRHRRYELHTQAGATSGGRGCPCPRPGRGIPSRL